jgi:hypothetical protein
MDQHELAEYNYFRIIENRQLFAVIIIFYYH